VKSSFHGAHKSARIGQNNEGKSGICQVQIRDFRFSDAALTDSQLGFACGAAYKRGRALARRIKAHPAYTGARDVPRSEQIILPDIPDYSSIPL
jgi:hypothetical protein